MAHLHETVETKEHKLERNYAGIKLHGYETENCRTDPLGSTTITVL